MRYFALACDYDGTIAPEGKVDKPTLWLLRKVADSGRRLILVTGRRLEDLLIAFPEANVFDLIVAEDGALLHEPRTGQVTQLAPPFDEAFVAQLRRKKVPVDTGHCIVATREPNETAVLETIRDMGLDLQVIFNKGAVMVLPAGVNKATGLSAALAQLELSPHNAAGIGDAENDHAFLALCEFSAAVANALPAVKSRVDHVTKSEHGAGVREFGRALLRDDLRRLTRHETRHNLVLGRDAKGVDVVESPFGGGRLLLGPSQSGKSSFAKAFLARLIDSRYQFCVVDPEGDYEPFEEGAIVLGSHQSGPSVAEILQVLRDPGQSAVVNLVGVPFAERPGFFNQVSAALQEMRSRTGRPHWLVLDETHHLLPRERQPGVDALPQQASNVLYITTDVAMMLPAALATVEAVFIVGAEPEKSISAFASAIGTRAPSRSRFELAKGEALVWRLGSRVQRFSVTPSRFEHRRHRRKYAEGDVGPDLSFYFRGPDGRLNLRAQNLIFFAQIAEGVDDETWDYHLRQGHFSRWFRDVIKDPDLADDCVAVEKRRRLTATESRQLVRAAIHRRYTLPAAPELSA